MFFMMLLTSLFILRLRTWNGQSQQSKDMRILRTFLKALNSKENLKLLSAESMINFMRSLQITA